MVGQLLLNLLQGDPLQQAFQQGGAPAPGPQGGAPAANVVPGAPSGQPGTPAPPPPQQMAQAQATQSPPDLQKLYIQLLQRNRAADEIDRGLTNIVAAFSPPASQASVMANMPRGESDPGALLSNLMQMRNAQAVMNAPPPPNMNPALWNLLMPDQRAKVAGDILEQQAGIGGPPVMQEMQRGKLIYMRRHGITDPNDPSIPDQYIYPDKYLAAGTAEGKQAGDIAEFKDSAIQDYPKLDEHLDKSLNSVTQLLGDKTHSFDDTMTALTTLKPTTGKAAANMPHLWGYNPLEVSQSVKDQAVAINTLKGELSADVMSGMKNIRNINEFKSVVSSMTAALDAANSPDKIQMALENIKGQILRLRAVATAAAGHKLTGELVGKLGPDEKTFLDPSSPYYNGATQEEAPSATPTPWQIQRLKDNPDKAAEFDARFGPGAARTILGQ